MDIIYRDVSRKIEFDRVTAVGAMDLRAVQNDERRALRGLANPFDQETVIWGLFREVVRPGAFAKTVREGDQVALWDHNTGAPLARKSRGTLQLWESDRGLEFEIQLGEQSWAQDAWISVQRGDVQGMSIGFQVVKQSWTNAAEDEKYDLREILEAKLYEVSLVTFPAYDGTSVEAARSVFESQKNIEKNNRKPAETTLKPGPGGSDDGRARAGDHLEAGPGAHADQADGGKPADGERHLAASLEMLRRRQQQADSEKILIGDPK